MEKISISEFAIRQPWYPKQPAGTDFYLSLANELLKLTEEEKLLPSFPSAIVRRLAMCITDYVQDVSADAGVWRGFINECRNLYGVTLPFYNVSESYTDFEVNPEDVRFLCWYCLAMYSSGEARLISPYDDEILKCAETWASYIEKVYEDAPVIEDYKEWREIDLKASHPDDAMYHLANWIFLHCFLTVPAASESFAEIINDLDDDEKKDPVFLQKRLEKAMTELPTGPLAFYTGEWMHLILEASMPASHIKNNSNELHPYYKKFTDYTGGKEIMFFKGYEELNRFFIEALGWAQGEEHLSQMKGKQDYILMVNPHKGMLAAVDLCRCIASPDNPLYDKAYAELHSIELLTVKGKCPADLLKLICSSGWLPDAHFPNSDTYGAVANNWDFIARCYLQLYYRGD